MSETSDRTTFCVAEDRAGAEIGLRLAVLSIDRWCPGSGVVIFRQAPTPGFRTWIRKFRTMTLVEEQLWLANGWDCKPMRC